MANGSDRFENERSGGSFVMGLLTGTVLGAGLGMLFAPKSGSELRSQLSDQAGTLANQATEGYKNLANQATEGYKKASDGAAEWADRGRELYDKTKDAVSRGTDEAQRYVREASSGGSTGSTESTGGSSHSPASTIPGSPMGGVRRS